MTTSCSDTKPGNTRSLRCSRSSIIDHTNFTAINIPQFWYKRALINLRSDINPGNALLPRYSRSSITDHNNCADIEWIKNERSLWKRRLQHSDELSLICENRHRGRSKRTGCRKLDQTTTASLGCEKGGGNTLA